MKDSIEEVFWKTKNKNMREDLKRIRSVQQVQHQLIRMSEGNRENREKKIIKEMIQENFPEL